MTSSRHIGARNTGAQSQGMNVDHREPDPLARDHAGSDPLRNGTSPTGEPVSPADAARVDALHADRPLATTPTGTVRNDTSGILTPRRPGQPGEEDQRRAGPTPDGEGAFGANPPFDVAAGRAPTAPVHDSYGKHHGEGDPRLVPDSHRIPEGNRDE